MVNKQINKPNKTEDSSFAMFAIFFIPILVLLSILNVPIYALEFIFGRNSSSSALAVIAVIGIFYFAVFITSLVQAIKRKNSSLVVVSFAPIVIIMIQVIHFLAFFCVNGASCPATSRSGEIFALVLKILLLVICSIFAGLAFNQEKYDK